MTLPANKTILGLTTKKDILSLPGFENLGNYLLKELKEFVRKRMKEYTTKKRGFTVGEYMAIYKKNPEPYKPSKQTARKNIKLQVKANKDKDEDKPKPKTRVKEAKDITTNDEFQALLRRNIEEREREEAERDRKWEEAREAARRRRQQLFEESLEDSDEDNGYKPKKRKPKK